MARRMGLRVAGVLLAGLATVLLSGANGGIAPATAGPAAPGPLCTEDCITEFPLAPGSRPHQIVPGPDGALWFTQKGGRCEPGNGNKIGRITVDGAVTDYPLADPKAYPSAITVGP